jgi:hypothetical protein
VVNRRKVHRDRVSRDLRGRVKPLRTVVPASGDRAATAVRVGFLRLHLLAGSPLHHLPNSRLLYWTPFLPGILSVLVDMRYAIVGFWDE